MFFLEQSSHGTWTALLSAGARPLTGRHCNLDIWLSTGAEAFDGGMPNWRGQRGLGAHHTVGIDATGIAAAKQLRMLNGAAHAHSAHKLIYRFRKRSPQESHARGATKHRNAAAGADDNAATPCQVT